MGIGGVSRTDDTTRAYLTRGLQLWKRAAKETAHSQYDLKPKAFLAWLENLLLILMPASKRQYIASTRAYLAERLKHANEADLSELNDAIAYITKIKAPNYNADEYTHKPWKGHTSSQKSKQCSDSFIASMVIEARNVRGKWVEDAVLWMVTNRLVGLRPSEWRTAKLIELNGQQILVVNNGKHSNERANGPVRHLNVTALGPVELNLIKLLLKAIAIYAVDDKDWHDFYTGSRKAVYRIARKILGSQRKYPSLYSTRHQFSADAKSAGMSKEVVAALMGHATNETAGIHYCLKKHGRGSCRVAPGSSEVATVRIKVQRLANHDTFRI